MAKDSVPVGAPADPDAMLALVKHQVSHEWEEGGLSPERLDRCVGEAVATVSVGRVATFASVLALRRVRACVRAGTCDGDDF